VKMEGDSERTRSRKSYFGWRCFYDFSRRQLALVSGVLEIFQEGRVTTQQCNGFNSLWKSQNLRKSRRVYFRGHFGSLQAEKTFTNKNHVRKFHP
jgi:hypothetical protein